ncbi:two component transcriptional regulator, LytTR family [Chishuiella changwenlii]|jgi:DNA-binding LytR/AlgR family response regulator|uniref:DNA-binding response regulator n=1 Tax=Chishuiella changwenlii TaxID=1434701 RepID=A0A1M6U563_9FLAO|nr:response regulator [Chishuiella changwenlii]GGE99927.1 DNA-binding response regulator [Chishuiella changwenlii]SHK64327.1 two component transcriptional regulator, LytTR family [Chishuiella changwenlii]
MNSTLKCILVDDEILGLKYLKMLCEQIDEIEVVKAYVDPELFINDLDQLEFDFCILDIEMPKINGLQVANLLKFKPFIFSTAYKEYAIDAFDLDAIDYIQKPIKKERLAQAINKIKKHLDFNSESKNNFVQLNSDKGKILLHFNQIAYIKTSPIESRDKIVIYDDLSELTLKNITLDNLLDILPNKDFIRVNKREIINIYRIKYYNNDSITLNINSREGKELNLVLSEVYKSSFISRISV